MRELRDHETWWQRAGSNFLRNRQSQRENPVRRTIHEVVMRSGARTVLEVACATAIDYPRYRDTGLAWSGLDITANFVARARELYPEIQVTHGSVLDAPFSDASFDFVYAKDLLEHLAPEDHPKALREMFRVCRLGFAIALFIPLGAKTEVRRVKRRWPRRIFDRRVYDKNTYGKDEFLAVLLGLGRVEPIEPDGLYAVYRQS